MTEDPTPTVRGVVDSMTALTVTRFIDRDDHLAVLAGVAIALVAGFTLAKALDARFQPKPKEAKRDG